MICMYYLALVGGYEPYSVHPPPPPPPTATTTTSMISYITSTLRPAARTMTAATTAPTPK